jgi:hypothetical protein
MNPSISIPGHFCKHGTGASWQCEIEALVSDLPRTVTGFVFHAHVKFSSAALVPLASIFVAKANKPRTVPSAAATVLLNATGEGDVFAEGTFGDAHLSTDPILISVCSVGTDASDAIDINDITLELVE